MSAKHSLKYTIKQILAHNKDGSFATQGDRKTLLMRFVEDLYQTQLKLRNIHCLRQKHIEAVVQYWQQKHLSNATIKNRMAALRWLTQKINKPNLIPKHNQQLNIGKRNYLPTHNKAIHNPDFSNITDPFIKASLALQAHFGLRRSESIKIIPSLAYQPGDTHLKLQGSWCKNGRPREIPIRTEAQRACLAQAIDIASQTKYQSLIPSHKNFKQQRDHYDKTIQRAGFKNLHGLRHAYAQQRYLELTGFAAPIAGGPSRKSLTPEQKALDKQARFIITKLLGHSRVSVVRNYCGS
jgi:site-specific recombinase XerD